MMTLSNNAQELDVTYKDGNLTLKGYAYQPKEALPNNPGVLILPAWMGIDEQAREMGKKLAELGYHAFVADIYGVGNYPKDTKQAGELAGFYKKNIDAYQMRIQVALDELIFSGSSEQNVAIIGYCFGGTGALEAARGSLDVKGVVSIHGGLGKDEARNTKIKTKVLILHGADDPFVPESEILSVQKEMKASKADWQMIYYANAVHAFTNKNAGNDNSKGAAYNELAAKRSNEHLLLFLKEIL